MNESNAIQGEWNSTELRLAQESIDRAGDNAAIEENAASEFLRFIESLHDATGQGEAEHGSSVSSRSDLDSWAAALTGATLGKYRIHDVLGSGGFGVVFSAFDPELERYVAIKIPRPDSFARDAIRSRFLHEARVAAMLSHPGIVPTHDVGTLGPLIYIASELCDGMTLDRWMQFQAADRSSKTVARLIMELADIVAYAHARGVIHQDLKPANVLTDLPSGANSCGSPARLRITDFGLSCRVAADGRIDPPLIGGTRRYMAPEQFDNTEEIGTHTDVYALGAMLDELLTPPGEPVESISMASRQSRNKPAHVPKNLWAIREKCLHPNPSERYAHATQLRDDLKRFLNCEPVRARRMAWWERGVLLSEKHPLAFVFGMLLIVSILAGLGGIVWHWREAAVQRSRAEARLRESESLLVRMSWALDESYFWNDSSYEFESDFRRQLTRDFSSLILSRSDHQKSSPPAIAAALRRLGHQAFERNDFPDGERITRQCLATWRSVREAEPGDRVYRRSMALAGYYLVLYGFSSGKNIEMLLKLDQEELVPGFSWDRATDVEFAEDLARLLQDRGKALEKIRQFPAARATHEASQRIWRQLTEHRRGVTKFPIEYVREHAAMGTCDAADGNHERATTEFLQSIELLSPFVTSESLASADLQSLWIEIHESAAKALVAHNEFDRAAAVLEKLLAQIKALEAGASVQNEVDWARLRRQTSRLLKSVRSSEK